VHLLLRQNLVMLDSLAHAIRELEAKIALHGKADKEVCLLSTFPKLGPILGNVIATEITGG
jgi:hypothetical protein